MHKVLVTGGGGFVGKTIVKQLIDQGITCKVAGRNSYPFIEKLGGRCLVGDIGDPKFVNHCCEDVDTVFHTAALAGVWGAWDDYARTNITGTENVINGCLLNKVSRLVYTSTPSVVFDGKDIENGDETLPYAQEPLCYYAKSKIIAEKMVFAAARQGFDVCAIRPHLIWGPGDPHLIPRLIERAKIGGLKIVGDGSNFVDVSYVENVAHAHVLAAKSLGGDGNARNQAYFIGGGKPVNLWGWINTLLGDIGVNKVDKKVTYKIAFAAGFISEVIYKILRLSKEPKMTRFVAMQLAMSHYFSHEKAEVEIGYSPLVSDHDGMIKLVQWIKENDLV